MAIDLTGITNENEFYTHYYIHAILENDLKELFKKWKQKEENVKSPPALLKSLSSSYFKMLDKLARERGQVEKMQIRHEFLASFFESLGYTWLPQIKPLDNNTNIPILCEVCTRNSIPELWVVEAVNPGGEEIDPLELSLTEMQFNDPDLINEKLLDLTLEQVVTKHIFACSEPPRWIILVSDTQIVLLDRLKWNEKRILRFDLKEIFGRKEPSTFQVMAAFLHRESLCPEDGLCLLDTLNENSHKHAYAVSEDLKYALRECIEILGNEAVWYLQNKVHQGVYKGRLDPVQLSRECLRFMYRLLFLFYIESRPELGYAPMQSEVYRLGYSLESLRDLELVKLTTEESRNGYFLHESLVILFNMIFHGFPGGKKDKKSELALNQSIYHTFVINKLPSHLFDPERTPLLNKVRFRNHVLQKVIQLMSLSRPASGRNNRRGRISYAQLGINQLGAVYEALLCYQGFFAETDLYEVKKAGETWNELQPAYFVRAEDLENYTEEEKVYDAQGRLLKHEKGKFLYRLAGRDRQQSASYYTPEVLTRCVVKYALKELLKDKTADEILDITICEPAMGSAAFLNEAVNQLAEAYLQKKQKELGEQIPLEKYAQEKQKVKMYLADNNVFGVDLNPVAVELAEVSLWLNTIFKGGYVPWFGNQLACGNSLIGARRQVFDSFLLRKNNPSGKLWLDKVPERISPGEKRPEKYSLSFFAARQGHGRL